MVVIPNVQNTRREGWFESVPLLLISVIVYNVAAWGGALMSDGAPIQWTDPLFTMPMISDGSAWAVSVGDIFIWISLILLFIEILRSTGTGRASLLNNALSILVFVACLVEFLLFAPFATSVFFTITLMTLLDVIAGFVISVMTARRDFAIGNG